MFQRIIRNSLVVDFQELCKFLCVRHSPFYRSFANNGLAGCFVRRYGTRRGRPPLETTRRLCAIPREGVPTSVCLVPPQTSVLLTLYCLRRYDELDHEMINTHAHLFTWPGTNTSLQPLILMAHEDVVPVLPATENKWTYPPFEGKIDDTWVWGRGSADCKNQLMGIMNAVEKLVEEGFKPER